MKWMPSLSAKTASSITLRITCACGNNVPSAPRVTSPNVSSPNSKALVIGPISTGKIKRRDSYPLATRLGQPMKRSVSVLVREDFEGAALLRVQPALAGDVVRQFSRPEFPAVGCSDDNIVIGAGDRDRGTSFAVTHHQEVRNHGGAPAGEIDNDIGREMLAAFPGCGLRHHAAQQHFDRRWTFRGAVARGPFAVGRKQRGEFVQAIAVEQETIARQQLANTVLIFWRAHLAAL